MENVEHDTLVWFGGEVKALDDSGKIGGYLVRFSTADDPDLAGDFFTKDTDFGIADRSPIKYHHGMDSYIKGVSLGVGMHAIKDDVGVWIEGQMQLRNEYEEAIFEMAKQGKLGWSSGTASHLVEREAVGKSWHIKSWPLGLDASLTPTPCEPRTKAIPLKSYLSDLTQETEAKEASAQKASSSVEDVKEVATTKTMENTTPQEQPPVKSTPQVLGLDSQIGISVEDYIKFQRLQEIQSQTASQPEIQQEVIKATFDTTGAPSFNSATGTGDNFQKAYTHWIKSGDMGGIKHMATIHNGQEAVSLKASNDTDMNIGTAADGGNAVPTGHFNDIIARRDEMALWNMLGVRNIPGVGTTVNVPIDAEDDGEFIATNEAAANDRDAPALGTVAMTLAKYTKRVELSDELLQDEESRLLPFIADFVGRGMAKTHNSLLLAEVDTNGTEFKEFAVSSIADGDLEDIEGNDDLGAYLEDSSVGWVMRNSVLSAIRQITASGPRPYREFSTEGPSVRQRELLGYPVYRSNKASAMGANNNSVYFGNWFYVGVRNEPEFVVLRDPYSAATTGQLRLHYYFRTVYKVLQAEAIGFGQHAAS